MAETMTNEYLDEIERQLGPLGDWTVYEGDLPVTDACRALLAEARRLRTALAAADVLASAVEDETREGLAGPGPLVLRALAAYRAARDGEQEDR